MKFSLDSGPDVYVIRGYGVDYVQVDGERLTQSFILSPETLQSSWPPESVEELRPEHCEPILALSPEIVIVGTGEQQRFPGPQLLQSLHTASIGIEVMSNAAACRTYNLIRNEGRRVVAAIMLQRR
jgi:uncharacterized protein